MSGVLSTRVLALLGTGDSFVAECPRCDGRWVIFSDLAGLTITASCSAEGCPGREIFAALGLQLGELEGARPRRAA